MNPGYRVGGGLDSAWLERIGPRGLWIARAVLVAVSVVALVSFGAQLVLAPVLVPAHWLAARRSAAPGRILFATLSALLVGEFGWMVAYALAGSTPAVTVGAVGAVAAGVVVFRSTVRRA